MPVAKQVKINPYIDLAEKENQKAATRQQKVRLKCTGSPSLSCPAGIEALSEQRVIRDGMSRVLVESRQETDSSRNRQTKMGGKDGKEIDVWM